MNPLDLRGPEFLAFYLAWSGAVLAVLWIVRLRWERQALPDGSQPAGRFAPGSYPREEDACAIALLRGGPPETARTVLARLVAGGALGVDGQRLQRPASPPDGSAQMEALELEVLRSLLLPSGSGIEAREAEKMVLRVVKNQTETMQSNLESQGLAPAEPQRRVYNRLRHIALAAILGLGLAKLFVGVSRGRPVGLLVLLLFAAGVACLAILKTPLQTPAGRQYLAWLQESHRGLVQMITHGRRTGQGELALAAGIYGLKILPAFAPLLVALTPQTSSDSGSGCSSSSGSGCGGGGCGGGGCGGCGG